MKRRNGLNGKNQRADYLGARGVIRLLCPVCHKTFGTFLHVPQVSIGCHCGVTISLEGLRDFRYDCGCCGRNSYGKTNFEDPEITVACKCGNPMTLKWDDEKRTYEE